MGSVDSKKSKFSVLVFLPAVLLAVTFIYVRFINDGALLTIAASDTSEIEDRSKADYDKLDCKFPLLNPWDPEILPYITDPGELSCKKVRPDISYIQDHFLYLNKSEVATLNTTGRLKCFVYGLDRGSTENSLAQSTLMTLDPDVPTLLTDYDIYDVICRQGYVGPEIYDNLITDPRPLKEKARPVSEDKLSVLLFFLESASHSLFQRQLPQTYDFLKNNLDMNIFNGYTKVGDNSFPNLMPVFTGKRVFQLQPDMPDEFGKTNYKNTYFDDFPLIWKEYAKKGYLTAYFEDYSKYGTFTYQAKGFKKKPVDYYYRPFYIARDKSKILDASSDWCYGNLPKIQTELDALTSLLKTHEKNRLFTYFFHTELGHQPDDSFIHFADKYLVEFFRQSHEENRFNKTVLFVLSDHGHRYSRIRATRVGQLEASLPMFSVRFPPWFYAKYPNIRENLKQNQYRLSSAFDLHQTLLDIVRGNFNGTQQPSNSRGQSQLYEIRLSRSCENADIPMTYCPCAKPKLIAADAKIAKIAAAHLISELNRQLANTNCVKLELLKIEMAELFSPRGKKSGMELVRIMITVRPSEALLQSLVQFDSQGKLASNQQFEVSRLNEYGTQSHCVEDKQLKKFCYCI